MKNKKTAYDRSTAEGQIRLFYEVASAIGKRNEAAADAMAYDNGWKDGNEGKPQNSTHRQYVRGWNDGNESRNA